MTQSASYDRARTPFHFAVQCRGRFCSWNLPLTQGIIEAGIERFFNDVHCVSRRWWVFIEPNTLWRMRNLQLSQSGSRITVFGRRADEKATDFQVSPYALLARGKCMDSGFLTLMLRYGRLCRARPKRVSFQARKNDVS